MKTFLPDVESIQRNWYVLDADGKVLGRLASRAASILMGKDKPIYTDFLDTGDFVVVVNAEKITLTGAKLEEKRYYSHSGYPGGLRETSARRALNQHPERVIEAAIRGMLPKNKLGKKMFRRLKVYVGSEHPHAAQKPQPSTL